MKRTEIRITGFGGQGVVLSGFIIGRGCAVNAGMHATMMQSFGPEARGAACSATVVVSEGEVLYPYLRRPDVLVAMSSDGCEKYQPTLREAGILIHEKDLVHPAAMKPGQQAFAVPSTRIAETLGRAMVQNIVMLGFFGAVTRIVAREALRDAVKASVPAGTDELNLKAFDAGWQYYQETYGEKRLEEPVTAAAAAP
ncbi:MAG: 2-oxoacid:acceptor oxidoreductase family protein [Acidobacteriota bacterium]